MNTLSPDASRRLIASLTRKVCSRMRAAGVRIVEPEEVTQELWVAWSVARNTYDATHGVPFGAYFYRGALNHINRWFRDLENADIKLVGFSLDDTASADDEKDMHEVIADPARQADEEVALVERRRQVREKLSPIALRFLELLEDPPVALYREIEAMKARAQFCRDNGRYAGPTPNGVTISMIADLMGLTRHQRNVTYRELKSLAAMQM